MAGCILIALMVSAYAPHFVNRVSSIGASVLPKKLGAVLLSFASKFVEGARVLRSPVRLASVVGLTVVAWLSNYVLFYEYVVLMNNTTPTPLLAVAIAVVLALAVALPSMPGFIGVYQAGCVCAFALFGISEEVAVSFAIVTHVYQYAVLVLYGLISFLMGSFKLSYLRQQG